MATGNGLSAGYTARCLNLNSLSRPHKSSAQHLKHQPPYPMPLALANYQNFNLPQHLFDVADDSFQTKRIDSFTDFISKLVQDNGLVAATIEQHSSASSTPYSRAGFITVIYENKLIAIINVSIQPTPFSQSAFTAYTQKTIAAGHNFQKAYREGAYGNTTKPFIGLITLLTRTPSPPDQLTYQDFCGRMMMERLYTASTLLVSGDFLANREINNPEITSFKTFVTAHGWPCSSRSGQQLASFALHLD